VEANPPRPSAASAKTRVFYGVTSWRQSLQVGGRHDVEVRASQCCFEFRLCAWTQSARSSEHCDLVLAKLVAPPRG
jgi:hypothetical protein